MSTTMDRDLFDAFPGEVIVPDDEGFDAALRAAVWNGDVHRHPAAIARPRTSQETAAMVRELRSHGLDFTVRGGGHNFAGHAVADQAVLIDLSRLDSIEVDEQTHRVRCGGGTTWAALDAATAAHSLAVPGGFISHTGVGGLTLGGGMGWLSRQFGLSCDNLVQAEVVTADGRIVTASGEENADLFWALRGGGGNFGIVTVFEFQAHPLNPLANVGLLFWPTDQGREPLRLARQLISSLPDDYGAFIAGLSAPPAPFVPAEFQGTPGVAVIITNWDSPQAHAEALAPLRAMRPLVELITPMPHTALQQMFDESAPWGILAYEKALYLDDLNDEVIDAFLARIGARTSPLSFVPVFPLGGKFSQMPDSETAFGGRRSSRWAFNIAAIAPDEDSLERDRAWVRDLWTQLRPHAHDSGGYINFLADTDDDRVKAAYGDKYIKLAHIKATWDPDNAFHHNANIHPGA